ncbi:MAG: T9SS type A sorting domain-containing protein [Candidatus Cloacimonas sp.]
MKKTLFIFILFLVSVLGYAQNAELSSPAQIGEAVANAGLTKKRLFTFQIKMTGGGGTLSSVAFTTNGTYTADELTKLQLWYNTANTFTSATNISTLTSSLGNGSHTFSGLNKTLGNGNHYFWITADIGQTLIPNHTLFVSAISTDNIIFTETFYKGGSASAGGTQYLEYVIVSENFDGTWPPSGWTFSGATRNSPAYSGGYSLELDSANDYAYTRKVNTPGLITFFALENTGHSYSFKIQYSTDPSLESNWNDITTYSNGTSNPLTSSFKFYSVDVHNTTYTNVYIRFYLESGNADIHIDDVNITLRSPNTQASGVTFSDVGPNRFTVSCTAGSAAQRIMFMKQKVGEVENTPVDAANGVFYTASTNWQDPGSQIGSTGYYCIYKGTGNSVTVTGLSQNTTYTVEVMEYNYSDVTNTYIYMPSPASATKQTLPNTPPANLTFSDVGSSAFTLTWTGQDNVSFLAFMKQDTNAEPADPTSTEYTASNNWNSKGTQLGSSGFYCIYNNPNITEPGGNSVTVTNLTSSTRYFVRLYSVSGESVSTAALDEMPTATKPEDYFASIASGNWVTVNKWVSGRWTGTTTWKSSRDGTYWNDATAKPTSSATKVYIEAGHIVTLTDNESCSNLHFDNGWIQLGSCNLTINSYAPGSGTPQFIYNGSGSPSQTGSNSIVSVTSQSIASLPSEVNTLRINLANDNSTVNLPNDVIVTNLAFDHGGLNMNSHKIIYKFKNADIKSDNAIFYSMNIRFTEDINTVGSNHSLAVTWYTSGFVTDVFQATMYFPSSLTNSSNLRLWLRNNATKGWYLKGEYPVQGSGDTKYIVADGLQSPDMSGIVYFDFTLSNPNQTLPVELSSFIVNVTSNNYVQIMWVTQSETELSGFRLYRGTSADFALATDLGVFIPATNTSEPKYYVYTDKEIESAGTYYYWLECMELNASSTYYGPRELNYQPGIGGMEVPIVEGINSIYPNPFNPETTIRFGVLEPATVKATVYNNRGQKVCEPINGYYDKGTYSYIWNATDYNNRCLSNGIYFIRLQVGSNIYTRKVAIVK